MTPSTVVVPGHGQLVDQDFVQEQRTEIGVIAETIRDLASRGVPVSQALEQGDWPWDPALPRPRRTARLRAPAPSPEAAASRLRGVFTPRAEVA